MANWLTSRIKGCEFLLLIAALCGPLVANATSEGTKAGLSRAHDPLQLDSSVALVADADTSEVLFAKNPHVSLPIASITKLMTVVVVLRAGLDLDELVTITKDDYDHYKGTWSRLAAGETFTRRDLIHLALMSSENRAASALGRSYPGGTVAIVQDMNLMARNLGMTDTVFSETTGLSFENRSTANDLALLVMHASQYRLIQAYSTSPDYSVLANVGPLMFKNTNRLIKKEDWEILIQKTGFIDEAGRCLVMQARVGQRNLVIVLLDSSKRASRYLDAERIRTHFASATQPGN
ncbi:MAG: serine hydrolase [Limnobacter sp.]|nr:serine hydrolase [Limnobacter sp.]